METVRNWILNKVLFLEIQKIPKISSNMQISAVLLYANTIKIINEVFEFFLQEHDMENSEKSFAILKKIKM